jgi:site-specific recombinase XerD
LVLPSTGTVAWTLIGPDRRPVEIVDEYLAWLTHNERSPNTVEAYARDLKVFWTYLLRRELNWSDVGVRDVAEFAAWARQPADNVVVLAAEAARRSPRTVNRMLTAIIGFYEFHGRRGNTLAKELVVQTRSGWGGYKPLLAGMGGPKRLRGRAVRLPEQRELPKTLSLEQVTAVIDCQSRLRDRLLFALLASTGMRIGQALALRHEDIVVWEQRIQITPRSDDDPRARSKGGASGSVPVPGELLRLWNDYMHLEYGDLDSDFVFVNLWREPRGRRLTYRAVDDLIRRTRTKVGFHFTAHHFRHTYATLAYRDGVAIEVIGALLTHRSPSSTLVYTHPTAADLRKALAERGVLQKVEDLITCPSNT